MEDRKDISKLTKVLIKDLKGERVVYQDHRSGKTFEQKKINEKGMKGKNKNYTWDIAWRTLLVIFIIDFGLFSYFKFYKNVGFVEGINGWITYTKNTINKKEKDEYQSVKKIRRKQIVKENEKIYSWKDKKGKIHYSNIMPIGITKNKIQEAKLPEVKKISISTYRKNNKKEEKILKYIVYLNEGGTFECIDVATNENILIFYTKKGMIMNLDKQKIKKIEKYQMVNNKLKVTSWNPFKKG